MDFGSKVVKHRKAIFLVSLILLIPSIIGMIATRINYDMLYYLPDDIETVQGQNVLLDEFGKGGFSMVIVENMKTDEVSALAKDIEAVDNVDTVINLEQLIDPSVPEEMLPDVVHQSISNPDASMLVVFFDSSTSAEVAIWSA